MKKITVLLSTFLLLAVGSMAQRERSPEDMAKMKEKRKTTLIDSLGVTSEVADSVLAIEDRYRPQPKGKGEGGDGGDRPDPSQFKAQNEAKKAELKKYLSDDLYNKYVELEKRNRRHGHGGPDDGGRPPKED
ncbi:MAG: hypothetical protein QM610_04985 [Chitinophagaceae bacterium]